jgi:hypothetical protein
MSADPKMLKDKVKDNQPIIKKAATTTKMAMQVNWCEQRFLKE